MQCRLTLLWAAQASTSSTPHCVSTAREEMHLSKWVFSGCSRHRCWSIWRNSRGFRRDFMTYTAITHHSLSTFTLSTWHGCAILQPFVLDIHGNMNITVHIWTHRHAEWVWCEWLHRLPTGSWSQGSHRGVRITCKLIYFAGKGNRFTQAQNLLCNAPNHMPTKYCTHNHVLFVLKVLQLKL